MTKEELSDRLNEVLDLEDEVDFTRMTKEDLERLVTALDPARLIQTGIKQLRSKARRDLLERPLKDLLDKPFLERIVEREEGFFGLGILPRILRPNQSKE